MDKALAKSKRAHSQHHSKKPHTSQRAKPSVSGRNDAANADKHTSKQSREKTSLAQRVSALPSNWDRYDEEFVSGFEDSSGDSASQAPDIIVPKSKGADFRHLIAEAQSQLHSNPCSDRILALDDVLPGDFNQFVGSLLAVRGESILSWIENDNFVVEDRTASNSEASFLSLNLHALAEQLEQVDLCDRLFIEEDLLRTKLHVEQPKVNNQESDQMQRTSEGKAAAKITEELAVNEFAEKANITAKTDDHISCGYGSQSIDSPLSNGELHLAEEVDSENSNCASVSKVTKFEAATAEAELDMLLNSFSESKLLDSSGLKSKSTTDFHMEGSPYVAVTQLTNEGADLSKPAAKTCRIDGLLDDLLEETPTMVHEGVDSSKSAAVNSTFDDVLDDLLQETSIMVNQSGLSRHANVKAAQDNIIKSSSSSSQSVPKSEILNDFDSWLDTI